VTGTEAALRLLAVEDDPTDRSWLELMLKDTNAIPYTLRFVVSMAGAVKALEEGVFDCALLDLSLPDCEGLESVQRVLDVVPDMAIVVFTGQKDQELGLRAIEAGAQDYLVKGQASGNTILQSARWSRARVNSRSRLQASDVPLVQRLGEAWACVGLDLTLDTVNPAFLDLIGLTETEALGSKVVDILSERDVSTLAASMGRLASQDGFGSVVQIVEVQHRSGVTAPRTILATPTRTNDTVDGLFIVFGAPPPPPPDQALPPPPDQALPPPPPPPQPASRPGGAPRMGDL
jgi:PAS domain S-box-containing protein